MPARDVDPLRLEVIRNALEGIADEMAITLYRTARSSGVRFGWDFSTAVMAPNGDLVGQGTCHPIHLGGMMPALVGCLDYFGEDIAAADVLISNDPYCGAQHLPDVYLFKPAYHAGVLVGYLGAICHHSDIGGRVPGGQGFDNTEIFQEGLRIPPLKLYQAGEPNDTLFRLIEKAVRTPDHVLGDLKAQLAALELGERRLGELVARLGPADYAALTHALIEHTERLTRQAIAELPDGAWSFADFIDNDGISETPIEIVATVGKQGDTFHVDFAGTSPQAAGSISGLKHMNENFVHMALRSLLNPDLPSTAGFFRPITIASPEGSFVNPDPPAAVGARQLGGRRINHAVWGALAAMAPERAFACPGGADASVTVSGVHKERTPRQSWVLTEGFNETACGGRPDKDGMDGQGSNVTNMANTPVEELEREHPLRIRAYGLVPDSEGPGTFRGGLAMIRTYEILDDEVRVQIRSDRGMRQPWGVAGGGSAPPPAVWLGNRDGKTRMPGKSIVMANAGDWIETQWCGAGGYGDPLARRPEAVLQDVTEEKITVARARYIYGVVLAPDGQSVDDGETRAQRDLLRQTRPAGTCSGSPPLSGGASA